MFIRAIYNGSGVHSGRGGAGGALRTRGVPACGRLWLFGAAEMASNPARERRFRESAVREGEHGADDVFVSGVEILVVDAEERQQRKEADSLVTVTVRMVPHQTEGIC